MVQLGWVDAEAHRRANDAFYAEYQAGTLDIDAYIAFTTGAWRRGRWPSRRRPAGASSPR
jgi:hypothetical protein